ncbi:hypothetical protein FOL47_006010 [Perkinsus chesapeaki]|uniref:Universal minicircle sequence binding protein n=1 Tax=Perkinsus chesapeaki TaxID=330153 RepID=A0A7J6LVS1_PERCH|nr:hypothetical protein FOL47_006010 [Perkinsus chesapeaki]
MVRRNKADNSSSRQGEEASAVVKSTRKGIKRSRRSDEGGSGGMVKARKGKGEGRRKRRERKVNKEDDTTATVGGQQGGGDASTCSSTTAGEERDEISRLQGGVQGGPLFFEDGNGDSRIDRRIEEAPPKYQGKWRAVPPTRYYSEDDGNFEEEVKAAEEIKISSHGDKNYPGFKHHVEACSICGSEDHSGRCFGRRCNACFKEGHLMKDCPLLQQDRRRCNMCGQIGHIRKDCVMMEYRRTLGLNTSSHGVPCKLECVACGGIHTDGTLNCSPCPRMKTLWCTRCGDTGHHAWECTLYPMGVKVALMSSAGGRGGGHNHHHGKGGGGRRSGGKGGSGRHSH